MATENINIHPIERGASALLGGMLLLRGIPRFSLTGITMGSLLLYRGLSGHSYLYQTLGISTANGSKRHKAWMSEDGLEVVRSLTIEKPAHELYQLWRNPHNLSQIMGDIADITTVSNDQQHWTLHAPFNKQIEWDTRIVENQPDTLLHWKSLDGAPLSTEGSVSFRPAPRDWGTEVTLRFRFEPPGGEPVNIIAKPLNRVIPLLAEKVLRRYKSLAETGEIPTIKHNPAARPDAYTHA